jgi:rhodanese-related sulfurtransferase
MQAPVPSLALNLGMKTRKMVMRRRLPDPNKASRFFEQKMAFTVGPAELKYMLEHGEKLSIFDVRRPADYAKGHIPGAVNLPYEQWQSAKGLSKSRLNIFCCYTVVCHLAAKAALHFSKRGYHVMELDGGMESWKSYGYSVERESSLDEREEAA